MTGARLACLLLASLLLAPTVVPAAIVQKWQTAPGESYSIMGRLGDLNGDGVYDLLTGEGPGTSVKLGLRSGATGVLLAQTALTYTMNKLWIQDLDGDDIPEIIGFDGPTGHCTCFNWPTAGSGTIAVRWTTSQAFIGALETAFVDFDGNGKHYVAFMVSDTDHFVVYDRNGVQAALITIPSPPPPSQSTSHIEAGPFNDGNNKEELWVQYGPKLGGFSGDELWIYQSSTAVGVPPGEAGTGSLVLSASRPNPMLDASRIEYSVPTSGPASLTLFDVSGREIRTLVNGPVTAGPHEVAWDGLDRQGRQVPPGAYFYELNAGGQHETRRLVRLR